MKWWKFKKKSLEHVSNILGTFDTYPIYNAVYDVLEKSEISDANKKDILNVIQTESFKLKQISDDAKNWVDAIIEDI